MFVGARFDERAFWDTVTPLGGHRVALALIDLRTLSERFEARRRLLLASSDGVDAEHPDPYRSAGVAFVPRAARWSALRSQVGQANLGRLLDAAVAVLEEQNPELQGRIPRIFARPGVAPGPLGQALLAVDGIGAGAQDPVAVLDATASACPDDSGGDPLGETPEARRNTLRSLTRQAPTGGLLDRLDEQLRELDRLLEETRRTRRGS